MSNFDYGETLPDGQHERHPGLREGEPVPANRLHYIHKTCKAETRMPEHCARQYLKDPSYYGRTFCCRCENYFPVPEFDWATDGKALGERL